MFKIFIVSILLTIITLADDPVLKTGQKHSYDAEGNVVTLGTIRDDGYYLSGADRNYTRNSAGVVIDHVTGLEWQDDYSDNGGSIAEKPWLTQANYYAGNYNDTSGDTAATYCSELGLDGGGWRLPTVEELLSLTEYSHIYPAIDPVFTQVASSTYWSSTTYVGSTDSAWYVHFYDGHQYRNGKSASYYVRCVRSGQVDPSAFERDDVKEIVTDHATGLQWQDDSVGSDMNWSAAIDYCEALTLGGYSDWRLPNINELYSIVDLSVVGPACNPVFTQVASNYYWSSTTDVDSTDSAWNVLFYYGNTRQYVKTYSSYVRCVRSGQFDLSPCGKKQGTDTCITRESKSTLDIYLPSCESGRLVQGQDIASCDDTAEPVDPPGFTLPTCDEGTRLDQGTENCVDIPDRPIANAGTDQNVSTNTTVFLDGSASSDLDGDSLTYSWSLISKPEGSTTTLINPTEVDPTFVADQDGSYIIELIVNDGSRNSEADRVTVNATTKIRESCKAYLDVGESVGDGMYTIDPDGDGNIVPFDVYCDMSSNGGGFTIKTVTTTSNMYAPDAENYCSINFDMQLFIPRTEEHLTAAVATHGADYFYIMGIYPKSNGQTCSYTAFNSVECHNWAPKDNGKWYVSNRSDISEPNGDNNVIQSMYYQFSDTLISWYNDNPSGYSSQNFACSAKDENQL